MGGDGGFGKGGFGDKGKGKGKKGKGKGKGKGKQEEKAMGANDQAWPLGERRKDHLLGRYLPALAANQRA